MNFLFKRFIRPHAVTIAESLRRDAWFYDGYLLYLEANPGMRIGGIEYGPLDIMCGSFGIDNTHSFNFFERRYIRPAVKEAILKSAMRGLKR